MKLLTTTFVTILSFAILTSLSPTIAAFGNGSSFTNAVESKVKYSFSPAHPLLNCQALLNSSDANVSIISATLTAAKDDVPEHCLVYGVIAPEIQFVVQFPSNWNRRLYIHGNGNDGGESIYDYYGKDIRNAAVRRGFVASFSNMGHDRASFQGGTWAKNNLQRELDFGYRSLHLNTIVVKQMIESYYGREAAYSYFDGCSTGGGQGLKAAQRFPDDFDGILAGAPVSDPANLLLYFWNINKAQEIMQFDNKRLTMLGKIIMKKYDEMDGVKDGVINNPASIDFKPERDLPRDNSGKKGFTDREISGLSRAYGGMQYQGREIAPGLPLGAELTGLSYKRHSFIPSSPASAWEGRVIPDKRGLVVSQLIMDSWFRYVLFDTDEPEFDWRALELETALPKLDVKAAMLSGRETDLSPYQQRGGKLLLYTGWGDVGVNPYFIKKYYDEVLQTTGPDTSKFARLFMIPGMFHCKGGYNVDRFDGMTSLINWVEAGHAPDRIIGKRLKGSKVTRSRPLCPYPKVASYVGKGSTNKAENFECK
ncbi:MAG: tannase/feruloyl esterase family alpha/beta hydrolase [Gammaproteobacteria bacterium]|jgi:hypothetical protein|nr:tannase/feruloyl esterase family alpha/beta hydrolase [Gammaproteobacteria bacterium]